MRKRILDLFENIPCSIIGENAIVTNIAIDSRTVRKGSLFFAYPGASVDGRKFIAQAVNQGASAVCTLSGTRISAPKGLAVIRVNDVRSALSIVSERFWNHPSSHLSLIAITGTNGKTTTSYYLRHILKAGKRKAGIIGTIQTEIGSKVLPASLTTPEASDMNRLLHAMVRARMQYAIAEISSQGIDAGRVDDLQFAQALFTNLSGEHLDHHRTMEAYYRAKARLFSLLPAGNPAIINIDNEYGQRLAAECPGAFTVSTKDDAYLRANIRDISQKGTKVQLIWKQRRATVTLNQPGLHNCQNYLMAAASALLAGVNFDAVAGTASQLPVVSGRLEPVQCGQNFGVFVDYAHTDNALEQVLTALRAITAGRLIIVFGAGGDRDRKKRPRMGRIACRLADKVILTSDNPRTEDPDKILKDIRKGTGGKEWKTISDRREAIAAAINTARKGDAVLIAGKGHEDYQIIGESRHHFSDREIAAELMNSKVRT